MQDIEKRPWQGTLLAWLEIVALAFVGLLVALIGIFGYAGFKGGEMGTMIGIFSTLGLIFLIPVVILDIFIVIGIFKGKKWAVVLALVFSILGLPTLLYSLAGGFFSFFPVLIYFILSFWMEVKCLKLPYYKQK